MGHRRRDRQAEALGPLQAVGAGRKHDPQRSQHPDAVLYRCARRGVGRPAGEPDATPGRAQGAARGEGRRRPRHHRAPLAGRGRAPADAPWAARGSPCAVRAGAHLGLRDGELAALTWADVDLESATPLVHVTKALQMVSADAEGPATPGPTKTECSVRTLPLHSPTV